MANITKKNTRLGTKVTKTKVATKSKTKTKNSTENERMGREEIYKKVSKATGVAQVDVKAVIDGLQELVQDNSNNNIDTIITSFVTFKHTTYKASTGFNPKTGKKTKLPERVLLKARIADKLKSVKK